MILIKKTLFILIITFYCKGLFCQTPGKYRVEFTDKNYTPYSLSNPGQFLSEKALNRRIKQNTPVTIDDIPVNAYYLDSIQKLGLTILNTSKWFNSASVFIDDTSVLNKLNKITFIKSFKKTAHTNSIKSSVINKYPIISEEYSQQTLNPSYGSAFSQINQVNGDYLHQLGFKGDNMVIAVIDVGFYKANSLSAFDSIVANNHILGTKDFVEPGDDVYTKGTHGSYVLSIIAGNIPGTYIGTAPNASYWLLRSEDTRSEFPIEEDNWIAAAEFADSAGVDIINTSLGYYNFDDPNIGPDYKYSDMNGKTARISIAADIAASKGILVVVSAGNEGNKPWHYISAPADALNVLSVGAVDSEENLASFSSVGPSADGRIKPDIAAMGLATAYQSDNGDIKNGNGTSFSAPIISGLAACLWQAFPNLTNNDIIKFIKLSSNKANFPNNKTGYGIPNFETAYNLAAYSTQLPQNNDRVYPNPCSNFICINVNDFTQSNIFIEIYNTAGIKVLQTSIPFQSPIVLIDEMHKLQPGVYIIRCYNNSKTINAKIVKY
jgi:serine protease AprX